MDKEHLIRTHVEVIDETVASGSYDNTEVVHAVVLPYEALEYPIVVRDSSNSLFPVGSGCSANVYVYTGESYTLGSFSLARTSIGQPNAGWIFSLAPEDLRQIPRTGFTWVELAIEISNWTTITPGWHVAIEYSVSIARERDDQRRRASASLALLENSIAQRSGCSIFANDSLAMQPSDETFEITIPPGCDFLADIIPGTNELIDLQYSPSGDPQFAISAGPKLNGNLVETFNAPEDEQDGQHAARFKFWVPRDAAERTFLIQRYGSPPSNPIVVSYSMAVSSSTSSGLPSSTNIISDVPVSRVGFAPNIHDTLRTVVLAETMINTHATSQGSVIDIVVYQSQAWAPEVSTDVVATSSQLKILFGNQSVDFIDPGTGEVTWLNLPISAVPIQVRPFYSVVADEEVQTGVIVSFPHMGYLANSYEEGRTVFEITLPLGSAVAHAMILVRDPQEMEFADVENIGLLQSTIRTEVRPLIPLVTSNLLATRFAAAAALSELRSRFFDNQLSSANFALHSGTAQLDVITVPTEASILAVLPNNGPFPFGYAGYIPTYIANYYGWGIFYSDDDGATWLTPDMIFPSLSDLNRFDPSSNPELYGVYFLIRPQPGRQFRLYSRYQPEITVGSVTIRTSSATFETQVSGGTGGGTGPIGSILDPLFAVVEINRGPQIFPLH